MDLVNTDNASTALQNTGNQKPTAFQGMVSLPLLRQLGTLVGLAGSVALGVAIVLWMQRPDFVMLQSQLSGQTINEAIVVLERNNIRYSVDANIGALMVESSRLNEAKLKLASENLSMNGGHGFEIIDKDQGFGTSSFLQTVRYQRALEGELARTISEMKSVQTARVHLAIPKESAFIRTQREATASVMVNLNPGYQIEKNQIKAIQNLVASGISSLKPSQVTVVDNKGILLSTSEDHLMGLSSTQLEYTRSIEKTLVARVERMLTPIVGMNNVRAQVTADIDFTQIESTQESFNPDLPAVRSEQSSEEQNQGAVTGGVPGALSNQPPATATAPENVRGRQNVQQQQGSSRVVRRNTKNYELDKTISHTRHRSGNVRRLSVAVVLDNKFTNVKTKVLDEQGNETEDVIEEMKSVPYTQQELERITNLVKETVGFNSLRGDSVNVVNAPFTTVEIAEIPELPFYETSWFLDLRKYLLGTLAVLLIIFAVLRPALKNLSIRPPVVRHVGGDMGDLSEDQISLSDGSGGKRRSASYEDNLMLAQSLAVQEPKRVVQVVKTWMGDEK